ncbi:hypothetical protein CDAR_433471 [Caerostris darwini]|uniref:Uncharacterized protein n=1 Tax=Caerostris darwini TaxID=1538125 RepID=A0AAV4WCI8_9ARAC|nr:hypothetical protein CDAR_433471 [Caerostris darwini]
MKESFKTQPLYRIQKRFSKRFPSRLPLLSKHERILFQERRTEDTIAAESRTIMISVFARDFNLKHPAIMITPPPSSFPPYLSYLFWKMLRNIKIFQTTLSVPFSFPRFAGVVAFLATRRYVKSLVANFQVDSLCSRYANVWGGRGLRRKKGGDDRGGGDQN